nr:rubrerythrin [uncultured Holophaga sp.]
MATYLKCRACDYIAEEGELGDVCPVCGLPRTVFEPYNKKISDRRRLITEQHLHPIAVHLPQVLLLACVVMPILARYAPMPYGMEFRIIAKWSVLILPIGAIGAFCSGLLDGKVRFKKLSPPLLAMKIRVGISFMILCFADTAAYLILGFHGIGTWIMVVVSIIATACAIFLGRTGARMFSCILPG